MLCIRPEQLLGGSTVMKNFLLSALIVAAVIAIGAAGGMIDLPWLLLIPAVALVAWPDARRLVTTNEFTVILVLVLTVAVLVGTLAQNRPMFSTFWFQGVLGLVFLSAALCLVDRLPATRKWSYILVHGALLVALGGAAVRNYGKEEGFLHLNKGLVANKMLVMKDGEITNQARDLPFSVRMDDFMVEFYDPLPKVFVFKRDVADAVAALDVTKGDTVTVDRQTFKAVGVAEETVVPAPGHPPIPVTAAQVEVNGKLVKLVEGNPVASGDMALVFHQLQGEPKVFQSRLSVLDEAGEVIKSQDVVVNAPLIHDGWWLYQANWDPRDPTYSGIHAVHDPGAIPALIGLVLLVLGTLAKIKLPTARKE